MGLDLVTLGESMVQLNASEPGPLRHVRFFERHGAGSESNVAIGAVRMGVTAGWVSRLGRDEFGTYLLNMIRGEGVDVSQVVVDEESVTGVYFVQRNYPFFGRSSVAYYRSNSAASRLSREDLNPDYLRSASALHVTGITLAIGDSARRTAFEAAKLMKAAGGLVSFDVNLRKKLWPVEEAKTQIQQFMRLSDILFLDEVEWTLISEAMGMTKALNNLHSLGPRWVVLKRSAEGLVGFADGHEYDQSAFPVEIVDKTGAGDALAAAFLAGILKGREPQEALRVAAASAAMVCMVRGDFEGMPTWQQAESWIEGDHYGLR